MIEELNTLGARATQWQFRPNGIVFSERMKVERAIFVTAKELSRIHLGTDIQSFSAASRLAFDDAVAANGLFPNAIEAIHTAFEIRSALKRIATGDSYSIEGLRDVSTDGRRELVKKLGRRLARYCELATELLT